MLSEDDGDLDVDEEVDDDALPEFQGEHSVKPQMTEPVGRWWRVTQRMKWGKVKVRRQQ